MHLLEVSLAEELSLSELQELLRELLSGLELRSLLSLAALRPFWAFWARSWARGMLDAIPLACNATLSAGGTVACLVSAAAACSVPEAGACSTALASQGESVEEANLPLFSRWGGTRWGGSGMDGPPGGFRAGAEVGVSCPAGLGPRLEVRRWTPATSDGLPFTILSTFLHSSPSPLPPSSHTPFTYNMA